MQQYGLSQVETQKILDAAREQISLAAIPNFSEEIGKAKRTYEKIIEIAFRKKDVKTAICAQDKLTDLLKLNESGRLEDVSGILKEEEDNLVRRHLESMDRFEKGLPLEELARQVSLYFAENVDESRLQSAQDDHGGTKPPAKSARTRHSAASANRKHDKTD